MTSPTQTSSLQLENGKPHHEQTNRVDKYIFLNHSWNLVYNKLYLL